MQLFGTWIVRKFGSFGRVLNLFPCKEGLEAGEMRPLVTREASAPLSVGAASLAFKIVGEVSFIVPN